MKSIIRFMEVDFEKTHSHLLQGSQEEAAFLLAGVSKSEDCITLLVKEVILVPNSGFIEKSGLYLEIDPEYMAPVIKQAKLSKLSVISLHSHPFSGSTVSFSCIDDRGETLLMSKIQHRIPDRPHATMVFGQSCVDARIWLPGSQDPVPIDEIKIIGRTIKSIYPTSARRPASDMLADTYHRQILALGKYGQYRIQQVTVGIVGLSGTGSHIFQQLAHLGVRKFVIADNDVVKDVNLSRIVGSVQADAQKQSPKTEVMERLASDIGDIHVKAIRSSIELKKTALAFRDVDVIFCCTDNLRSRLLLNRLAFQYLVPLIDMGIDIQVSEEGKIRAAGGRVMVITPEKPCLSCLRIITPEGLQKEEDVQSGYVSGDKIADPSVISLNGVVASLAVTEFIDLLTGFERRKDPNTYQLFDILRGVIWRQELKAEEHCGVCTEVRALGDNQALPCNGEGENLGLEN